MDLSAVIFVVLAVVNAVVAVYIYRLIPEFQMRFVIWMLVHTMYRVSQRGLEHLPAAARQWRMPASRRQARPAVEQAGRTI